MNLKCCMRPMASPVKYDDDYDDTHSTPPGADRISAVNRSASAPANSVPMSPIVYIRRRIANSMDLIRSPSFSKSAQTPGTMRSTRSSEHLEEMLRIEDLMLNGDDMRSPQQTIHEDTTV